MREDIPSPARVARGGADAGKGARGRIHRSAVTGIALAAMAGPSAWGQELDDLRELLRSAADSAEVGKTILSLNAFATLPDVSAATFTVSGDDTTSDTEILRLLLPLAHEFDSIEVAGAAPYTELTLGYLRSTDGGELFGGTPLAANLDNTLESFSAVAGFGLGFPVLAGTTLRPLVLVGYSRIEDDGDWSGPGAEAADAITSGFLTNFHVDAVLYGGALEIEHDRSFEDDIRLTAKLRYSHLAASTIDASDSVLEGTTDFGVLTANAVLDMPTDLEVFGRELRWLAFVAGSRFEDSEALGFDYFLEAGAGIELIDREVIDGVDGVSLRASAIVGDDVRGWNLGLRIEF